MRESLQRAWLARSAGERRFLRLLALLVVLALYAVFVASASQARPALRASVTNLRADAARLEQMAAEVERLRAVRPAPAAETDLRTLLQAQAGMAGIQQALVRLDAPDPDRVQAVFGAVAFRDWLRWAAALGALQVRLETCRIEAMDQPGLVSVTASFVRAGR